MATDKKAPTPKEPKDKRVRDSRESYQQKRRGSWSYGEKAAKDKKPPPDTGQPEMRRKQDDD
jgi:hypothetical protein